MQSANSKIILIISCVIFFALGSLTAVNGPLLAEFAQLNHTDRKSVV